ncbi:MAG TPA: membrane-bound lytic murein transglycosylase MltF [Gammaproteobacteria bacterium]|nr:membrane-bound lytic murein transglycosylase MltF [Gammaproteobacteria bacterium]MCP5429316.1 membrane-bound lytic murein transglycosylase MltF [Chromatiaceae bacterium]HPQ25402.1 membrane-bound lytic murein transglycosylase MltF [Gammaproteobacteria bacterium]
MTQAPATVQRRIAVVIAGCLLFVGLAALFFLLRREPLPILQHVQRGGILVVATRQSPTAYYQGADGPDGFEYALIREFAEHLGVEVRPIFPRTIEALLHATEHGAVHMAAAGLAITPARERRVRFSIPYEFVTEQVIYRRGSARPRSLDDIAAGDLHVVAGSSHDEHLAELRAAQQPTLTWQTHDDISTERLLSEVDLGNFRLTLADSHTAALSRRVFQHTAVAFDLTESQPLGWAFSRNGDDSLLDAANAFLQLIHQDGRLERLRARYFGHSDRLNFVDTREFWRHVRDRLPEFRAHFEQASQLTGIDWRLLAAIGYQESHWRAEAVSPTGVRGIMMLTQSTAQQMGISDRNDPQQSIDGGARYLRVVEKKIPERIQEPNRLWLTLAGYNVGFGHLEDARILTERDGASPDLWFEVKQRLPLLADKAHYQTVKYGFARGQEAVDYVDKIRNYYDLLVWFTTTNDRKTLQHLLTADAG